MGHGPLGLVTNLTLLQEAAILILQWDKDPEGGSNSDFTMLLGTSGLGPHSIISPPSARFLFLFCPPTKSYYYYYY